MLIDYAWKSPDLLNSYSNLLRNQQASVLRKIVTDCGIVQRPLQRETMLFEVYVQIVKARYFACP